MGKTKADKVLNILLAFLAISCVLRLMLPTINVFGVSLFSLSAGIGSLFLVLHICKNVVPADRAARDKRVDKSE